MSIVPKNYTGGWKRILATKKLNRTYYIIDYYVNGNLIKTIRDWRIDTPVREETIKKYNIKRPELCYESTISGEPDEIIKSYGTTNNKQ